MNMAPRAVTGGLLRPPGNEKVWNEKKGPGKGFTFPAREVNLLSADWKTQLTRSTNSSIPARESLWVDL